MACCAVATKRGQTNKRDAADLGGIGEATLTTWAHEVGISPKRATHDVNGWDFLLVLPRPGANVAPPSPLDLDPPDMSCLVQVKATRDATKPIKVKLSNWQRLATTPLPAFFLVMEVSATNKPQRAFLVHVGEEWIARVLKRLRQTKPSERGKLNRRSLALSVNDEHALPGLDGTALSAAIREATGTNAYDYFSAKRRWIETVGYEEGRFQVTFTFGVTERDELYDMMADFAIGERKQLPIASYRAREVRFGIAADIRNVKNPQEAFLELPAIPSRMNATIEVRDADGVEVVALACKTYPATTIFPFLPAEYRKVALKSDGVTFVISPARSPQRNRPATVHDYRCRSTCPIRETSAPWVAS